MDSIAAGESGWVSRLRQANVFLFALLPAALLFSRGLADTMVVAVGLSFLIVVVMRRQWAIFTHPLILPLLAAWLILNLVVSPLALDVEASYSRSLPWFRFIAFFAAVAFWIVKTRRDVRTVALIWGIILLGVAADGLIQLLFGVSLSGQPIFSNRLTGPLDRPNIGIFVTRIGLPLIAAWVWLAVTRKHQRPVYSKPLILGFAALMMVFIFLTGERAASLLTIFALAAVVLLVAILLPKYRLHGFLGLAGAGLAIAGILLTSERILRRAETTIDVVGDLWDSIYGELIRAGLQIWWNNPLSGVGLKNYRIACDALKTRLGMSECNPHPHNIYVEWLSEAGLLASLGFAAFVIILLLTLTKTLAAHRQARIAGAFLIGSAVVTLFPFTVSQSFFSNWPAMLLWCSLACTVALARIIAPDEDKTV